MIAIKRGILQGFINTHILFNMAHINIDYKISMYTFNHNQTMVTVGRGGREREREI